MAQGSTRVIGGGINTWASNTTSRDLRTSPYFLHKSLLLIFLFVDGTYY